MINEEENKKIKESVAEFFQKATVKAKDVQISFPEAEAGVIELDVDLEEPQILIGQGGQTLFEIQRILKIMLNKKLGRIFYLNLDINGYKKKKNEYLKRIADDIANEVAFTKKEKMLSPMPAYERRVIHAELAKRDDVATESSGEGESRHIIIKPKS